MKTMKTIAVALGSVIAAAAASASAQIYIDRSYTYDPYYSAAPAQECWNPRARTFEEVRPGEFQDDLDRRACRAIGSRYYDHRYQDSRYQDSRTFRDAREECWNPRARQFEQVRPGEYQNDLDFRQCRVISEDRYTYWR